MGFLLSEKINKSVHLPFLLSTPFMHVRNKDMLLAWLAIHLLLESWEVEEFAFSNRMRAAMTTSWRQAPHKKNIWQVLAKPLGGDHNQYLCIKTYIGCTAFLSSKRRANTNECRSARFSKALFHNQGSNNQVSIKSELEFGHFSGLTVFKDR